VNVKKNVKDRHLKIEKHKIAYLPLFLFL